MSASSILEAIVGHAEDAPDRLALALCRPGDAAIAESATFEQAPAVHAAVDEDDRHPRAGDGERERVEIDRGRAREEQAVATSESRPAQIRRNAIRTLDQLPSALRAARSRGVAGSAEALRRWWLMAQLYRRRRYAPDPAPLGVRSLAQPLGPPAASALLTPEPDEPAVLAQHGALAREFTVAPDDVHMPCFPAVVLHNLACGISTVLPPIDLRHPGDADPAAVVEVARRMGVTALAGAPAYMSRVVDHVHATGERLSGVRRVVVGGAPVPRALCSRLVEAFPEADARILDGSTEAEPIAQVSMAEVLDAPGRACSWERRSPRSRCCSPSCRIGSRASSTASRWRATGRRSARSSSAALA